MFKYKVWRFQTLSINLYEREREKERQRERQRERERDRDRERERERCVYKKLNQFSVPKLNKDAKINQLIKMVL